MIIEAAIGDAVGAGYEYVQHNGFRDIQQLRYAQHPRHDAIRPGMYTDDTQMSLAIVELLVDRVEWNAPNIAEYFLKCFHRDPRDGYAGGFYKFLCKTKSAQTFLDNIRPDSDKSGAAMRAWPIGVLSDLQRVIKFARLQAAVTHNTPGGINSAVASALMTHYFLYALGSKQQLPQWLARHVDGDWDKTFQGEVGSKGWMSVSAAVTAVARNNSLAELLMDCLNFGGDVDTVATIALAAASCSFEYSNDIPDWLVTNLENGFFGRQYIQRLDEQLLALTDSV